MVDAHARRGATRSALAGFIACAVGLGPAVHSSAALPARGVERAFVIDCGPGRTGPELRLTREVRPSDDRATVTLTVENTGRVDAKGARFAEDLSDATDDAALPGAQATAGSVTYRRPLLSWAGDLAAGGAATVRYAFRPRAGRASIRTVDTYAGTTCHDAADQPLAAGTPETADRQPPANAAQGTGTDGVAQRRSSAEAPVADGSIRSGVRAKAARKAPIAFGQRYVNNFRGAVTRAGNTLLTCYPPVVPDCLTRRNGSGNNNVAAQFVDVDGDPSTFNSSAADLQLTAGAQIAYARLYWGGRSQTTTDTPGLPAGNRFSPNISQRGQILLKAPSGAYQTITASAADIGDTPDNTTATGIVYGASADVTSLVAAAGGGTYAAANLQAAEGLDGLGAFGGWSLVVAYRDTALPLRNISVFDGFLEQQNGAPDTTINLSGFKTPVTGPVNVQLGQIAYDGDNAITGDSLSVKTTNGPLTVLSDALHPPNNFFNSTIATLGNQVTARNPTYTNTLGYDSNILNASSAFRNNDTSAQFTFSTVGDAYWPHAFFTQIDLHQANLTLTKTAQVVGGGTPVPGSVVQYTVTATNTGDDNAINVVLSDPIPANTTYVPGTIVIASGPNAGPKTDQPGDDQGEFVGNSVNLQLGTGATAFAGGTLTPGQSTSATFRVTLGPNSPGTSVTNTSTVSYASADTPTQPGTTSATSTVIVPPQISSLALLKTAAPTAVTAAGQTVTYSFLVTNTGNTTLTNVGAVDVAFSGSGAPPVIMCPVTMLAPGQSTTCTGTYTTTQADVDAGSVVDTATASGTPPTGPAVTSNPSTATVTASPAPGLALLKTASPGTFGVAGRVITYSYEIVNTGNTTLTNVGAVDVAFSGSGAPPVITCPVTTLAPQASTTCTGTYTTTQADVDAGSVVDTATASGTPPTGPAVTSNPSTATVTASPAPGLALLKTASPSSVRTVGRVITYSYEIVNTGNTTLTNVGAVDVAFSGSGAPPVITCPVTTLAPGQSTTCTGTYTTTQADLDSGSVVNTATASGTPPTGPAITSDPSTATVTVVQAPSLALLKTAAPSAVTAAGQTVTYSYLVVNTGNTTLTNVSAVDIAFSGSGAPPVITCPVTTLAPGQSTTCTGTYTVSQADLDAGSVVNTATASGTPPTGPAITSDPSTATVTTTPGPQLQLLKTASPGTFGVAGRVITYSFLVVNTGNVTLTNVGAVDVAFSGSGAPPVIMCPVTMLAPGQSTTCTGTYTTTQADVDAGSVVDTATASGTPPTGPAVTSNPSTATVTASPAPGLALLKTASPSSVRTVGRVITYSYEIVNTGNTTLTNVGAVDVAFSGSGAPPVITCPVTTLAPGQSTTCTGTYTTTQADLDSGSVVNTATASGTPPTGPAITSNPSTATVTAELISSLVLLKTAVPSTVSAAGQTVTYSYEIVNTGNTTLTNVSAVDIAFSGSGAPPVITCPVTTLAPGQSTTCTGTYTVSQADLDAGSVVNTATASGTPPTGPAITSDPSTATVTATPVPGLALLKTAVPAVVTVAGETVTYSFVVTNTGNTTLTNVSATDTGFSGSGTPPVITCPVTTLAPQQSTTCTGTYAVTQADIDAGSVVDTATASGTPPTGPPVTSNPSTATVTATSVPGLTLLKTAAPTVVTAAGQTITYSYAVTNIGNTTLTGLNVVDTLFTGRNAPPVIACPVTTLEPQQSTTCTGTYTVTQADIDAGSIVDTAIASGTPPTGPPVTSNPSTATVTATPAPGLALLKTATPLTVAAAGQTVTYSFLVTNTGNTTSTNVSAADIAFSGTGTPPVIACPVTTLEPQQSTTCTGTYTVTQADIDAGSIVDTATASGTPPTGPAVTSNPSTATVTATPAPLLGLLKTANPSAVTAAGQSVTYSYLITNTGNTTVTGVNVTDTVFSGTGTPPVITCPVTTLAPQESTTCTSSYTVTQPDINSGSVVNTATASAMPPSGPAVSSNPSTAAVVAAPVPDLTLLKTANPSAVTAAGQTVTYSYLITNTGNTTLANVSATDTAFSGTGTPPVIACPVTTLAPQQSTTCTGTYTVTQADIGAGSVVNTATASGTPPTGPAITSPPSTATVTVTPAPALALLKTARPASYTTAGEIITYSYLITNTGNTGLTNVSATDTAFSGSGTPPVVTCPVTTLAPQQSTTCTGTYAVTQADIDNGVVTNTAIATGTPPTGPPVTSPPSTAVVPDEAFPELTLAKTATPTTVTAAGQTVTYSYLITNTGNTTLANVSATDTAFSGTGTPPVITCPVTTLAPQQSTTCTGTYVVTRADVNAGTITNAATASGTTPTGTIITSDPSTATVTTTRSPLVRIVKPGTVAITNNGNTTIAINGNGTTADLDLTQRALSGSRTLSCPVTTLAPNDSTTCTVTSGRHTRRSRHRIRHRDRSRYFTDQPAAHRRARLRAHKNR